MKGIEFSIVNHCEKKLSWGAGETPSLWEAVFRAGGRGRQKRQASKVGESGVHEGWGAWL